MRETIDLEGTLDPAVVRHRFAHAKRSGNPQWLWPDTDPADWQACLVSIEGAIRSILAGDRSNAFLEGNPKEMSIAAFTSGMGPLLGYWGQQGMLRADPSIQSVLDRHLAHNSERMAKLSEYAVRVITQLTETGLRPIVLKGMHTAYSYFPDAGTRPLSDIDLVFDAREFDAAIDVLKSLGYYYVDGNSFEQTWRLAGSPTLPCSLELVHRDDPWSFDIHRTLDRQYSPGTNRHRMSHLIQNRKLRPWSIVPEAVTLSGPLLVIYLAFHASTGLGSLSLLRLTEIVFVIRQLEAEDSMRWDEFIEICREVEPSGCTYPAIRLVNLLAPETIPERVLGIMESVVPDKVRSFVGPLTPATCQRVRRCSFRERVMWISGFRGWVSEIWLSLFPRVPLTRLLAIYRMRFWRIVRGIWKIVR